MSTPDIITPDGETIDLKTYTVYSDEPLTFYDHVVVNVGAALWTAYDVVVRPVVIRPLLALGHAYAAVLTGTKIDQPLKWSEL